MTIDPFDPPESLVQALRNAGCVFAEDEARVLVESARRPQHLQRMLARRCAGEPLEHVVGWTQFCGLRVAVTPGVFVPRRRTELLATEAIRAAGATADPIVVELCCGSGAVSAAVRAAVPRARLHASDVDENAVRCAASNLPGAELHIGDLYAPLPASLRGSVDVLVANAPYVPSDAVALMPPEARDHEPRVALDGGSDGLQVHRRIAAEAPAWLATGGMLLIEVSSAQVPAARSMLAGYGLEVDVSRSDDLDATVLIGHAPPLIGGSPLIGHASPLIGGSP